LTPWRRLKTDPCGWLGGGCCGGFPTLLGMVPPLGITSGRVGADSATRSHFAAGVCEAGSWQRLALTVPADQRCGMPAACSYPSRPAPRTRLFEVRVRDDPGGVSFALAIRSSTSIHSPVPYQRGVAPSSATTSTSNRRASLEKLAKAQRKPRGPTGVADASRQPAEPGVSQLAGVRQAPKLSDSHRRVSQKLFGLVRASKTVLQNSVPSCRALDRPSLQRFARTHRLVAQLAVDQGMPLRVKCSTS
jgi:hypothetical protein